MKYIILTLDLGRPMYFMDHPFPTGFSISTNLERAAVIEAEAAARQRSEQLRDASGFHCQFVNISSIARRLRNTR